MQFVNENKYLLGNQTKVQQLNMNQKSISKKHQIIISQIKPPTQPTNAINELINK